MVSVTNCDRCRCSDLASRTQWNFFPRPVPPQTRTAQTYNSSIQISRHFRPERRVARICRAALTVHLALVGQDDFPPSARRVDSERLLEALLDVGAPHALGVVGQVIGGRDAVLAAAAAAYVGRLGDVGAGGVVFVVLARAWRRPAPVVRHEAVKIPARDQRETGMRSPAERIVGSIQVHVV